MLLESILICFVILLIFVFFYKQSNQDFNILQVESLPKAITVLTERSPIVVYPFDIHIALWTRQDLLKRPSTLQSPLRGTSLDALLNGTPADQSIVLSPHEAETLADTVGVRLIVENELFQIFCDSLWWSSLLSLRTEALIGAQGLRKTYAHCTMICATEGSILVSLLNNSSEPYLPTLWEGKRLKTLTRDEAPHLEKIKYVDVIVRPGSLLIVPPHWKLCWESHEDSKGSAPLTLFIEIHHPVSRIVDYAAHRDKN